MGRPPKRIPHEKKPGESTFEGLRDNIANLRLLLIGHRHLTGQEQDPLLVPEQPAASSDEDEEEAEQLVNLVPSDYDGDAGEQAIQYMMGLLRAANLSSKRGKGKHPSSEHQSNGGPPPAKVGRTGSEEEEIDPTYNPPKNKGRGKGRSSSSAGRGRGTAPSTSGAGRGRGSGRGRGLPSHYVSYSPPPTGRQGPSTANTTATNSSSPAPKKGEHWRPNELSALINGANHLKPVIKGRFKHSTDGVTLKKLAWEELRDYVMANGGRNRSTKQCQDKLGYFVQEAKKKRQRIDAKYKTGSGQRDDADYLTDLEAAACDYAGEEVTLGINGMQPPSLKSGIRLQIRSCYDPERMTKEDYSAIAMPSSALAALEAGDLLEEDAVEEEREEVPEIEIEEEAQYQDADEEMEVECTEMQTSTSALEENKVALERISRTDMLRICSSFNDLLSAAAGKKKPKNKAASILLAGDRKGKTKESLIPVALKSICREETLCENLPPSSNLRSSPRTSPKTEEKKAEQQGPKKKIRKTPSFTSILNESDPQLATPPDSPDPPSVLKQENPRTYSQEEVDAMLKAAKQKKTSPPLCTSTPVRSTSPLKVEESTSLMPSPAYKKRETENRLRNPVAPPISASTSKQNTSGLARIQKAVTTGRKKALFTEKNTSDINMSDSLISIPPPSPAVENIRADRIYLDIFEEQSQSIARAHVEMNTKMIESQQKMAESTRAVAQSVCEALNKQTTDMERRISEWQSTVLARLDEANETTLLVQEKLVERILTKEARVVQSLEKLERCLTQSQETVVTGIVGMADGLIKLNRVYENTQQSLAKTTEVTQSRATQSLETLSSSLQNLTLAQDRNTKSYMEMTRNQEAALENSTTAVQSMAANFNAMAIQQERSHSAQLDSTLSLTRVHEAANARATEAVATLASNLELLAVAQNRLNYEKNKGPEKGDVGVPDCPITNNSEEVQEEALQVALPVTSAYLTHPEPPDEGVRSTYNVQSMIPEGCTLEGTTTGNFIQREEDSVPMYALAGSDIQKEHGDEEGEVLPDFRVLSRAEFLIVPQPQVLGPESNCQVQIIHDCPSEADTEGSTGDMADDNKQNEPKRSKRIRKPKIRC